MAGAIPTIHERMVAILAEMPSIGKTQKNPQQNFMYRGHDDVMNALNPLLAKHGVFIIPNVVERITDQRKTAKGTVMYEVNLHVEYTFYGAGGDSFVASAWGEGTDMGDKSTNKAMTMAFKNVVAQSFAVSSAEFRDADGETPEETVRPFDSETDLHDGAIKGADAPKRLYAALSDLDPTVEWAEVISQIVEASYGVDDRRKLNDVATQDFWRRLSNAVYWMDQIHPSGSMPPITADQITAGFAYAFHGHAVEVVYKEIPKAEEAEDEDRTPPDAA